MERRKPGNRRKSGMRFTSRRNQTVSKQRDSYWRKIVIDGIACRYHVGRVFIIIRSDAWTIRTTVENVRGCTPDVIERGRWKKTSDGMITPRHIVDFVRMTLGTNEVKHCEGKAIEVGPS